MANLARKLLHIKQSYFILTCYVFLFITFAVSLIFSNNVFSYFFLLNIAIVCITVCKSAFTKSNYYLQIIITSLVFLCFLLSNSTFGVSDVSYLVPFQFITILNLMLLLLLKLVKPSIKILTANIALYKHKIHLVNIKYTTLISYFYILLSFELLLFATSNLILLCFLLQLLTSILILNNIVYRILEYYNNYLNVRIFLYKYHPEILIPYCGGEAITFHIPMWEPLINKVDSNYIIIVTRPYTLKALKNYTDRPILCLPQTKSLWVRKLMPSSVSLMFFTQNSSDNRVFLNNNAKSIFLHHGDSDKEACYRQKTLDTYNFLFVAGQAAIDRYSQNGLNISDTNFRIIGRPQLHNVNVQLKSNKNDHTILYAPTWFNNSEKSNYSSLDKIGVEIVKLLLENKCTVIFRPHPIQREDYEKKYVDRIINILKKDRKLSGRPHVWGKKACKTWSVSDAINNSDAMISDVSGIVTDYMQSLKPFAMTSRRWDKETFRKKMPTSQSAYIIQVDNSASISQAIKFMLGEDPLSCVRLKRKEYYLSALPGNNLINNFVRQVNKIKTSC